VTVARPSNPPTAPYLVISRIGPDSLHSEWLEVAGRGGVNFLLSSYDAALAPIEHPAVRFETRTGTKVAGYAAILRDHAELIGNYRYVALFDDDLSIDAKSLLSLFELIDAHGFKIAQPALDHESFFTYACLLRHHGQMLRHVNFIEMMCPIFRSDILLDLAPLFDLGFESGIDLVWSAIVHQTPGDFAVIDSLPVRHSRPVGSLKSVNGFTGDRIYETDIHAILARFELPWLPTLPYAAVRSDGRTVRGRLRLLLGSASLVRAIPIRSASFRLTAMATYWYQLLAAPARNVAAAMPATVSQRDSI